MASEEQIRIRDIVVAPPEAFGRKFALGAAPGQTYRGEIIAAVEAGTWLVHWEDDGAYLATEEKYLTLCVRPAPLIEPTPDATPDATRKKRSLEDTSGGVSPQASKKAKTEEKVEDYEEYFPTAFKACIVAGSCIGVGFGVLLGTG